MKPKPKRTVNFTAVMAKRAKLRAEGRCVFCGAKLAVPDPAALKRKKLEAKIARLNDELRRLALPPIPKSEGLGEDVPIGAKTARRAS